MPIAATLQARGRNGNNFYVLPEYPVCRALALLTLSSFYPTMTASHHKAGLCSVAFITRRGFLNSGLDANSCFMFEHLVP